MPLMIVLAPTTTLYLATVSTFRGRRTISAKRLKTAAMCQGSAHYSSLFSTPKPCGSIITSQLVRLTMMIRATSNQPLATTRRSPSHITGMIAETGSGMSIPLSLLPSKSTLLLKQNQMKYKMKSKF